MEFASLTVEVNFSQADINLGLPFLVQAYLYERDGGRDRFIARLNGGIIKSSNGNGDDYVGEIGRRTITPSNSPISLDFHRIWDFGDQEGGNEEYYAVVAVTPRLPRTASTHVVYSKEIKANLG